LTIIAQSVQQLKVIFFVRTGESEIHVKAKKKEKKSSQEGNCLDCEVNCTSQ
jgi:hypothetical protein